MQRNVLLGVVAVCLVGARGAAGGNLLANPGFEQSADGVSPSGWSQARGNPARWLAEGGRDGSAFVRILDRGPNESIPLESKRIPARPCGVYRGAGWLRTADAMAPGLFINFYDDVGRRIGHAWDRIEGPTGDWRQVTVEAVAPPAAWSVSLYAYTFEADAGACDVDDLSLTVAGGGAPQAVPEAEPGGKAAVHIGSRRELFVDSFMIDGLSGGVERRLHAPQPRNIALKLDAPWEGRYCGFFTVVNDDDHVRLYYRGWPRLDSMAISACVAVSTDGGVTFRRPELSLFDFDGIRTNNIVWRGPPANNFTPFRDANPDALPERRYKATASPHESRPIVPLASPDGFHWTQLQDAPIITNGQFDSQNEAFWDPHIGKYVCYYRYYSHNKSIRDIRRSTSEDFLTWGPSEDLRYGAAQPEHLYTSAVFPYPRAPHILIGMPNRFVPERDMNDPDWDAETQKAANLLPGVSDAVLMSSRNGIDFERWTEAWIRPPPDSRSWIDRNIFPALGMVQTTPEEISVYWDEYNRLPEKRLVRGVLRTDGFVSIHAGAGAGELLTRPFTFEGDRLEVNFATSAIGYLHMAVCDEAGNALPGFSFDETDPFFGNAIAQIVDWPAASDLAALAGTPVRLRVRLKDADLYAFRFRRAGPERRRPPEASGRGR
ncbi:MAG: hypothetical protein JW951_02085 [Lentisphaerae bacterium]|nr:hypothetical protein [Lentisphaerota bacterium]